MAGPIRNASQGNHVPQQRPYGRKQIACRLCNLVFINTQALITHIESHILEEDQMASRSQNNMTQQQINQTNNNLIIPSRRRSLFPAPNTRPFRPVFPLPSPFCPGTQRPSAARRSINPNNLVLNGTHINIFNLSQPPNRTPQGLLSRLGAKVFRKRTLPPPAEEESPGDCTRLFLRLLDRPIPKLIAGVVELEKENGDKLNLELKL